MAPTSQTFTAHDIEAGLMTLFTAWNADQCTLKAAKKLVRSLAIALTRWSDDRFKRGKDDEHHHEETRIVERILRHWMFEFQKCTKDRCHIDLVETVLPSTVGIKAAGELSRHAWTWPKTVEQLAQLDAVEWENRLTRDEPIETV